MSGLYVVLLTSPGKCICVCKLVLLPGQVGGAVLLEAALVVGNRRLCVSVGGGVCVCVCMCVLVSMYTVECCILHDCLNQFS